MMRFEDNQIVQLSLNSTGNAFQSESPLPITMSLGVESRYITVNNLVLRPIF
jgi:hypothetical protein